MPPPAPPRRRGARRAAAAVEFAVVSLVFCAFILGAVELGRGFMVKSLLANAARQGCRTAVPPGRSTADVRAAAQTTLDQARVRGSTVTVLINGAAADASTAVTGDRITVSVTVPVANITWVPFARHLRGTITGRYTLRRE